MIGDEKLPIDELAQHGVKGMHWGAQRKGPEELIHPSYTPGKQRSDAQQYGAGGVKRINSRLNAGQTRQEAQHHENVRMAKKQLAIAGGVILVALLAEHGNTPLNNLASHVSAKAEANRAAARALVLSSTVTKVPYVKIAKGAYKITTMK